MYVIFYNDKPILLAENNKKCKNFKSFNCDKVGVKEALNLLKNSDLMGACFVDKSLELGYNNFVKNFKIIEAAGGLVKNSSGNLLFIFRNGLWDLPKGKVEKNESVSEAALREVKEECGVSDLKIDSFFDKTYHIYEYKNQFIFKLTHWFKMTTYSNNELIPQLDEGITKTAFLDANAQKVALKNTYPNLIELLKRYQTF